jgi:O-succinylbenzoic acid--CoA ligase
LSGEPIFADWEESWLERRAKVSPDAPALIHAGQVVDYRALAEEVACWATDIRAMQIRRGDVVAMLHGNAPEVAHLLWALRAIGAVLLPLNTRLTSDELVHQLRDGRARLLVHDAAFADTAEVVAERAGRIGRASTAGGRLRNLQMPRVEQVATQLDALALLYTSGTTGRPKGALLSAAALRASAVASEILLGADAGARWLACMPLFHVGGLSILVRSCLGGGCAIVHDRFDPHAVSAALDEQAVTGVSLVATMLGALLDARGPRPAPASLRCVLLGGGPTPAPMIERARALGYPVAPTYGLTEAASQVATRLPGDLRAPADGHMQPLPATRLRIVDEQGVVVPAGAPGEIQVCGPTLMSGYLGDADATRKVLAGGWLRTGDLGCLDAEGRLQVHDRRDDLIVSGGENVYPAEVEAVLCAHPGVSEAGVAARADDVFGARPVAWWVPGAGTDMPSDADLEAWCRARLASYKVPTAFQRIDALPRTSSGKLIRRQLPSL